jgi:5'(3')-deoxyribonucleotidase
MNLIKLGVYRHYKGNEYEVVGFAKHSETTEAMVVYKALYGEGETWTRPLSMWENLIDVSGRMVKRFEYVGNARKIVYFDMDNVLVDFKSGIAQLSTETQTEYAGVLDEVPGVFRLMAPIPKAVEAVHKIAEHYDVYILSTSPWKNPDALQDKLDWVKKYFGAEKDGVFYKRVIISHHKDLNKGDYLIDDRTKNGAGEFEGELIQFGSEKFPDWDAVVDYLMCGEKRAQWGVEMAANNARVHKMKVSDVYPLLVAKVERKGRTKEEVDTVTKWLTGYDDSGLQSQLDKGVSYEQFFSEAPQRNPNAHKITGVICGHRVEEIEDPVMQNVRRLDKLVDELAKGKTMEKILRT